MSGAAERPVIELSAEQQSVVDHAIGLPATVDAGAGTGKTHTVVARVVALHNGGACPASKILLLTFARKAAAELRGRILRELGPGAEPPHCATFHSFAHDVLRDHAYDIGLSPDTVILEDPDARVIFRSAYGELVRGRLEVDPTAFPLRRTDDLLRGLFQVATQLKQAALTPDDFERRALAAGEQIASIPYRQLRSAYVRKIGFKLEAEVDDAQFAREVLAYAARVRAAAALFRRFDELLRERTAFTYADLLFRADAEVRRRPALRDELRRRYAHCIVDEYQDTDVAQHHFLQAVFGDSLEQVVAVGDVRQSIYSFRGAHPENMVDFSALPGCISFRLTQSRRSRQEILDLAHHVIARDSGDDDPLQAHRGPAGAQVVHVASLWQADGIYRNAAEQRAIEARWLAAQVATRLSVGDVRPRDVAILLRNKTNARIYTDALLRAGVPFQLTGGVGFYDAPEVLDALAWLRLLANPLDSHAAARVVQSPVFGANDADIVALSTDLERGDGSAFARRVFVEPLNPAVSEDGRMRLARLRETLDALEQFAAQSLTAAFPAVLDRAGLRLYYEQSADRRAPQALANLRKLEQLAVGFAQRMRGASAGEFVAYVDELENAASDEREADASDVDAVVVSTIHNAKGLEWPVVFVADVWPDGSHSNLIKLDEDGALLCAEGGDGRVPFHVTARRMGADAEGWVPREEDRRSDDAAKREDRRLFYVALTRARDELYLSGKRKKPGKANPHGKAHVFLDDVYAWLAGRQWPADVPAAPLAAPLDGPLAAPLDGPLAASVAAPLAGPLAAPGAASYSSPSAPTTLSFTFIRDYERCPRSVAYATKFGMPRLAAGFNDDEDTESDDESPREPDSLLGLGAYGNLVHRALESWASSRIAGQAPVAAAAAIAQAAQDIGVKPSLADARRAAQAYGLITHALSRWIPLFAEAPFTLDVGGISVTGFMDLVALDPEGSPTVVDYKTGQAPASDYALQLALYRAATRAAYDLESKAVIARIRDDSVIFESTPDLDATDVIDRMRIAAKGIARGDDTPLPGPWCAGCAYRGAPCMSFPVL